MKLLDTTGGNPKLAKTQNAAPFRYAGLSLYPDAVLCPGSKAAQCMAECLRGQGRGQFDSVTEARQRKADWFYSDPVGFLAQLKGELENFRDLCKRKGERGAVRLNVLSDVTWEGYGVPQAFPELLFVDYTKQARRLENPVDNYRLIFSYSGAPGYRAQNRRALRTNAPVAVVFRGGFPRVFLGRHVVDGDKDDIANAFHTGAIVGLTPKGSARHDQTGFVVDNPELIARAAA